MSAANPVPLAVPPRRIGRSILAILAGIPCGVLPTLATDILLHRIGVFPPLGQYTSDGPLVLATFYRAVYGILGAYIIARLAPNRPMLHVMIAAGIGILVTTLGAIATWNQNLGPHWYSIALIVLCVPQAWLGAKLYLRRSCSVS